MSDGDARLPPAERAAHPPNDLDPSRYEPVPGARALQRAVTHLADGRRVILYRDESPQ